MEEVRNAINKLICRLDKEMRIVEIIHKGYKTAIRFLENGQVEIINYINRIA